MIIKRTPAFERQLKKLSKKHFPVSILKPCLRALIEQDGVVLKRLEDHALHSNWHGYRELHPARYGQYGKTYDGWLIIYQLNHDELVLVLVATGSHEVLNQ